VGRGRWSNIVKQLNIYFSFVVFRLRARLLYCIAIPHDETRPSAVIDAIRCHRSSIIAHAIVNMTTTGVSTNISIGVFGPVM
jgi:hypothetical protein